MCLQRMCLDGGIISKEVVELRTKVYAADPHAVLTFDTRHKKR